MRGHRNSKYIYQYYRYCEVCKDVFPFHGLDEDEFIYINCNCDMLNVNISRIYDKCKIAEMLLFKSAEFKYSEFSKDIDPDNYVYSNLISNLNYRDLEHGYVYV